MVVDKKSFIHIGSCFLAHMTSFWTHSVYVPDSVILFVVTLFTTVTLKNQREREP